LATLDLISHAGAITKIPHHCPETSITSSCIMPSDTTHDVKPRSQVKYLPKPRAVRQERFS